MMSPGKSKTFEDYARNVFMNYVVTQAQSVTCVDVVWDTYSSNSLKKNTRDMRGHGTRRPVVGHGTVPGNWQSFLRRSENVTSPFHQSHLNWVHDPAPPPSRCLESIDTVPRSDSRVNSSAPIPRNPLAPIPSGSWNNSNVSDPNVPHPSNSVRSNSRCVPRNNKSENEVSAIATHGSSPAPLSSASSQET